MKTFVAFGYSPTSHRASQRMLCNVALQIFMGHTTQNRTACSHVTDRRVRANSSLCSDATVISQTMPTTRSNAKASSSKAHITEETVVDASDNEGTDQELPDFQVRPTLRLSYATCQSESKSHSHVRHSLCGLSVMVDPHRRTSGRIRVVP